MKVWARDKYIKLAIHQLKSLEPTDAQAMRNIVGEILVKGLPLMNSPFETVNSLPEFSTALGNIIDVTPVNKIDMSTSLIIQEGEKLNKGLLDDTSLKVAAAFLKSCANVSTAKKKNKITKQAMAAQYEFLAKIVVNSIVEFNQRKEIA